MASEAKIPKLLISTSIDGLEVPFERIHAAFRAIMEDHQIQSGEVSIAIVGDDEIQAINLEHLGHDYPTDCISFIYENEGRLDGEIIVSAETAERVSWDLAWDEEDELLLYIIHGTLHLIGMDDQDEESASQMRLYERHYLMLLGVPGAEDHGSEPEDD